MLVTGMCQLALTSTDNLPPTRHRYPNEAWIQNMRLCSTPQSCCQPTQGLLPAMSSAAMSPFLHPLSTHSRRPLPLYHPTLWPSHVGLTLSWLAPPSLATSPHPALWNSEALASLSWLAPPSLATSPHPALWNSEALATLSWLAPPSLATSPHPALWNSEASASYEEQAGNPEQTQRQRSWQHR